MVSLRCDIESNGQEDNISMLPYPLPIPARSIFLYKRESLRLPKIHQDFMITLVNEAEKMRTS